MRVQTVIQFQNMGHEVNRFTSSDKTYSSAFTGKVRHTIEVEPEV